MIDDAENTRGQHIEQMGGPGDAEPNDAATKRSPPETSRMRDAVAERLAASDLAADKRRAGQPLITLDEDDNVIRRMPDGTIEPV